MNTALSAGDATSAALSMASFHHALSMVKMTWDVLPYIGSGSRKTVETNQRRRSVSNAQIEAAIQSEGSVSGASIVLGISRQAIQKRIARERINRLIGK